MVNLTSSIAAPFYYTAQLTAVTSGASATLNGENPALGMTAEELQKEADALHGAHGRRGRDGLPPAAHGWEKPQVQKALVKLGGTPADPAPAPVPQDPALAQPEQAAAPETPTALAAEPQATEVTQASATSPEASYYEKRIFEMAKALAALASQAWPGNSVALILITGLPAELEQPQAPAETPDLSGDDVVELQADVIRNVATGDGADAVALEGRVVDGVYTDRDAAPRPEWAFNRGGMPAWARGQGRASPYANADSVSIRARHARNISTGGGDDAIAIQAGTLRGLRAGAGNDSIAVAATLVSGIKGGSGDDTISVAAQRALRGRDPAMSEPFNPDAPAAAKMRQALSGYAQVDGGSGNDLIELQIGETLAARGGEGDDHFVLNGGTAALHYSQGDGHDTVEMQAGANAVVQLREMGASAYSVVRDGDTLTLSFDTGGSITFTNVAEGGAIGVATGADAPIALLHQPPALDATV